MLPPRLHRRFVGGWALLLCVLAVVQEAVSDGRGAKGSRGRGFPKEGPGGGGFAGRGTDITGLRLEDVASGMHSL